MQQLGCFHQHIIVRRKAVSALQKDAFRFTEICRNLLDVRFDFLYTRFPKLFILEIGAEQAVIMRTTLSRLQVAVSRFVGRLIPLANSIIIPPDHKLLFLLRIAA